MQNKKFLRNAIIGMKAGKVLSNTLGTSPTETPDVPIPQVEQKIGDTTDGGGGSEQDYVQSDQPNGGSMGTPKARTARSGAYLPKRDQPKKGY